MFTQGKSFSYVATLSGVNLLSINLPDTRYPGTGDWYLVITPNNIHFFHTHTAIIPGNNMHAITIAATTPVPSAASAWLYGLMLI